MKGKTIAPYGTWSSPISADLAAGAGIRLSEVKIRGRVLSWLEGRPLEGGRSVPVTRDLGDKAGEASDAIPPEFNARTRVHEYGGGSYDLGDGFLIFTNFADQRLYRVDPDSPPAAITPEGGFQGALRYADMRVSPENSSIVAVREIHTDGTEAKNEIVLISADGSGETRVIASGRDFYSSPRFSPDGSAVAWLSWDHPNMPWDGTELWVTDLGSGDERFVAGGKDESIVQPEWGPTGQLSFASDRSGWWNLYVSESGEVRELVTGEGEMAGPAWVFGLSYYTWMPDGSIIFTSKDADGSHISTLDLASGTVRPLELEYASISYLASGSQGEVAFVGGSQSKPSEVAMIEVGSDGMTSSLNSIKAAFELELDPAYIARAERLDIESHSRPCHAYYYPPTSRDFEAPAGELPPLLVISHGGPTSSTSTDLRLDIQFWSTRGFAVVDVDYGGSTGYGREYRELLTGQWGVVDTEDCIATALYLVDAGLADRERMAIRGGSAGGYTTLCALTMHDVFKAGASYYGVADAETLAIDTHKFESRYLDKLIGPYPEARDLYRERSPIDHIDGLSCPVILLQGLEDEVVPPNQAEAMIEGLEAKGIPWAYVPFEGEQHGFRKAENQKRALEAELYFYGKVFGFEPAGPIEPVEISGLSA